MNWKTFDCRGGRPTLDRKIGDILEGDKFKCSLCGATGILPGTKGIKCPVCKGAGMNSLKGPVTVCAYCKGRGNYPRRTNITCTVCSGGGLVSITKPVEVCGYCRGTGAEPGNRLPCLKCKGKGVVKKIVL
ncbi:MAG: hypothetical protein AABY41_06420 [Nitrospirota bacterium]